MATITVTLGDFVFKNYEVPESINFGGEQSLAINKQIGGQRIINAMGRDDSAISWSGIFTGATGEDRTRYLDGLRVAGNPLIFTYGNFRYNVVIKSFVAKYKAPYIDYSITLEVIEDLTKPITTIQPVSFDQAIFDAFDNATDIAFLINNPTITNLMTLLQISMDGVTTFTGLSKNEINTILAQVTNVQSAVSSATQFIEGVLF